MSVNHQLLSTHAYSKELSLLDDGIVNGPRDRQKQTKAAKIGSQRNRDSRAHRSKWKVLSWYTNREPKNLLFYFE